MNKTIGDALLEKKGHDILDFDLSDFEYVICQNFIICHGDSNTQVRALVDNVEKKVKEDLGVNIWRREGTDTCQWALLDYGSVIVHVFQKEFRDYYKLEELWADAACKVIADEPAKN